MFVLSIKKEDIMNKKIIEKDSNNSSIKGTNIIELMLVIVLFGIGVLGAIVFMKKGMDIWSNVSKKTGINQIARTAMIEMENRIRESSGPLTLMSPGLGATSQGVIDFKTVEATNATDMKYYQNSDKFYRVVNGVTTTLIWANMSDVYFVHESSYVLRIDSFTLTSGNKKIILNSKVFMRNK